MDFLSEGGTSPRASTARSRGRDETCGEMGLAAKENPQSVQGSLDRLGIFLARHRELAYEVQWGRGEGRGRG